jgi:tRNA(Ile)-lysidine synthase
LQAENPRLAENVSAMAQRLRLDEQALADMADCEELPDMEQLKQLAPAVRSRMLERFLKKNGVREPEAQHIALAESLVFSPKPSAAAEFPGGVRVGRNYGRLEVLTKEAPLDTYFLPDNGVLEIPGWRITVSPAQEICNTQSVFTIQPQGKILVRCRLHGDEIKLPGGTKSLKKLFIDRKIPAHQRLQTPIIADDAGLVGVYGIGINQTRSASMLPATQIQVEKLG